MALPNIGMNFTPYDTLTAAELDDIVENIEALADGSGQNTASITGAKIAADTVEQTNLHEKMPEYTFDFIASGCVWSGDAYASTRNASCSSGVVYLNGVRLTVAAVVARTFTASKDVYCDLHDNGDGTAVWVYTDTTTNAASPALTAGNLRGAIIVVGAGNIAAAASVNQGQEDRVLPIALSTPYAVTDSLGNLICPRDPNRKVLGYRQNIAGAATGDGNEATICAVPFIAPTGRKVKVTGTANIYSIGAAGESQLYIKESTTYLSTAKRNPDATSEPQETTVMYVGTPTAGPHTYLLNFDASTNNVGVQATATQPTFILVELA